MSEFRKGRKRFISRDPPKAENSLWKEEYSGRRVTGTGADKSVAVTSKNDAIYFHQPNFDPRTSDLLTCSHYLGSSTSLSSLKNRSARPSSPNSRHRSEFYASRPSGDRQSNDVTGSRDRSALRVISVDTKTRIGTDKRMASEMGFRPILRRHGSSSSSSCESLSLKDNGIVTVDSSSKTALCPVPLPDPRSAPAALASFSSAAQKTESSAQQGLSLPGTFLTLPANADSMQVQIKDTKISITRRPEQLPAANTRLRTLSAEYDNVPETVPNPSPKLMSVAPSVLPAFPSSFESPGQLSPVRGLRLVPSPNSAFTKTKATKASAISEVQNQSKWTVPAMRSGADGSLLELERCSKPTPRSQPNNMVHEQNPIDFHLIFSGIGLRPLDSEVSFAEKRRTFRALKSCSLENVIADWESGKKAEIINRACPVEAFELHPPSWLVKTGTNKVDAPPISKTTGQSSAFISQLSQLTSRDNQPKLKRVLTEAEIQPQSTYPMKSSTTAKPITDAFTNIGQPPSAVQQPITDSVVNASTSLALKLLTDPFTTSSIAQPLANSLTNLHTSTVAQPITSSKQPYREASSGPITSASTAVQHTKFEKCFVAPCISNTGPASRPITISTTSFGKVNVSTYILPPSLESTISSVPLSSQLGKMEGGALVEKRSESTIASAMYSLEKAISMLNSVAMDTSSPGVPMTLLSTIATDTESLAKSFQLEASTTGTQFGGKPADGKIEEVVPLGLRITGAKNSSKTGSTSEEVTALRRTYENPVREDAVLNVTLNLLDQTLAEIQQEFPEGRSMKTEVGPRSKALTSGPAERSAFSRPTETTPSSKTPWDSSISAYAPVLPWDPPTFSEMHWDGSGSRMTAEISEPDQWAKRMLDRQDSFNRPGSSLYQEPLPLPKDSVIQRYRRKKKNKSSASSSSSSSTSSYSAEDADGNGAAGAKRSPRSGRHYTRRQRLANRAEDGAAAAAGDNRTKNRACHRRRRGEELSDREQDRQTSKHPDIQESKSITYALSSNVSLTAADESVTSELPLVNESWLTLAAGPVQEPQQALDSVYPSAEPSQQIADLPASVDTPLDILFESQVQPSVTENMIGAIYASSGSDSERIRKSGDHRNFRNLGKVIEDDGGSGDLVRRVSPQSILHTSASSPKNLPSSAARSHSSGSCSPADTSTRAKNLTPFSHRGHRLRENRSPAATGVDQVVSDHRHHLSSSSDRLSAASADEEVFLARVPQSLSPNQKLSDDASQAVTGPSRNRIRSKESISSGAHGCDYRAHALSPDKVHSDSDRGPRQCSFTGSARLTLKQKSQDLTDDANPQKIKTVSTRTSSSTDEMPGVISARSRAISYESICLKIKDESIENPKTIQVISLAHPSHLVSTFKAVLAEEPEPNASSVNRRSPTFLISQSCDIQSAETTPSDPTHKDQSTKHRSTVFLSSKKSTCGTPNTPNQKEAAILYPVQASKINSFPVESIQKTVEGRRKVDQGRPSEVSEIHNQKRSETVITLSNKRHDTVLQTSPLRLAKSEDLEKTKPTGESENGETSHQGKARLVSTEPVSANNPSVKANPGRLGKESKFSFNKDNKPENSLFIMGTDFTHRHKSRQNLLFPGADYIKGENSTRTLESKASESSNSVHQVSGYKIKDQNGKPITCDNKVRVVPEKMGDGLVREAQISTDGSAKITTISIKSSGSRVKSYQPMPTPQGNSKVASQFLSSLSKLSQPTAKSISISASQPRPPSASSSAAASSSSLYSLSRVGWAKQRLGQTPESKASLTTISQLQTSLKNSAPSGTHPTESTHQQVQSTNVAITSTSASGQDRTKYLDGKHTVLVKRQELPSVGDGSSATIHLSIPVPALDVTVSQSPLVHEPAKRTISPASSLQFTTSEEQLPASLSFAPETQNPAITGNLTVGMAKVFIQSPHAVAVSLSDSTNFHSSAPEDSAKSKDSRFPELEVQLTKPPEPHVGAESIYSFQKLDNDSTGLLTTASPSFELEETVIQVSVCEPPISDVLASVQELAPILIVESVIPDDNQVVVLPIDKFPCQEQQLTVTETEIASSKSAQERESAKYSPQASLQVEPVVSNRGITSDNSVMRKVSKYGQVTQEIRPSKEGSDGKILEEIREPYKEEISSSDSLTSKFEQDSLLKARKKSKEKQTEGEVSPNETGQQRSFSESNSPDTLIDAILEGFCSKTEQSETVHDFNAVDSQSKLSQLNRNPESFESPGASNTTDGLTVASSQHQPIDTTPESPTETREIQGLGSQTQLVGDLAQLDSRVELLASGNHTISADNCRGSDEMNESFVVGNSGTEVWSPLKEDNRVKIHEMTDHSVKPGTEVVRRKLSRTPAISSMENSEEKSTTTSSSSTTTSLSSTTTTSLSSTTTTTTSLATASRTTARISATKAQKDVAVSQENPLFSSDDNQNQLQTLATDTVTKDSLEECRDTAGQFSLPSSTKTDSGVIGLTKTAEIKKTRRCVRFESQEELPEFSPKEFSASGDWTGSVYTPADVPAETSRIPLGAIDTDITSAPAAVNRRAVVRPETFEDLVLRNPRKDSETEDLNLKSPRKEPETFEELPVKSQRKEPETFEDLPVKSQRKEPETFEDLPVKSQRKEPETFEDLLLKTPPRKDSETSRDDASKTSPSAGKTMAKPCIVRKQLIHLDSALHPSSCVSPESKSVEARWSPKLVRKLNLAEAKDVDVSDLNVAPDLMDFLSKQMDKASIVIQQPVTPEEEEELVTGAQEILPPTVQRKPPLSLPLKSSEREEDVPSASVSAAKDDIVQPEAEVGKRKFFSALKANAVSLRAKKVVGVDDPSPDKSNLDRLASFAIISDVGIGAKRRQFQQKNISTDPTTDAHATQSKDKLLTPELPLSTNRFQMKDASLAVSSSSGANDNKMKTRLGREDESKTRLGSGSQLKTRHGRDEGAKARLERPEVDSDDDFDQLVEINFRQLVDEKSAAAGIWREGSALMEQRRGARNQTGTGLAGTSGPAGVTGQQSPLRIQETRRQLSRFKTQPVTTVEVEKAQQVAFFQNSSQN